MKICKTAFWFEGESPAVRRLCDTVEYKGMLWLVPKWAHNSTAGTSKPTRMVLLGLFPHQKSKDPRFQYFLNNPIPKSLFDQTATQEHLPPYAIVENPPGIEVDTRETSSE